MKILITGIGCIGKSSLREKIAVDFPDQVVSVDRDYTD
jgi:tRNA A37 N6-isopentenylltransferase MiaA